jgi:DNA-binding PadR family transcriptional regulator
MGVYQPSSGALYPALRRLERRGLLRTDPGQRGDQARPRRRYVYHITEQGLAAHTAWVRKPVNPATVAPDLALHLMRFVMMERVLPRAEVLAFLADLRDALEAFLRGLEDYVASSQLENRHPALALDHGIAVHGASLAWTKRTINALARGPAEPVGPPPWLRPDPGDQRSAPPQAGDDEKPDGAAATRPRGGHR